MSKNNPQWSGYIVLGDTVNIYNSDKNLAEKRQIFPNIDEILVLENRISFLKDCYNQNLKDSSNNSGVMLCFIASYLIGSAGVLLKNVLSACDFQYPIEAGLAFILAGNCGNVSLNMHKSNVIANNYRAIGKFYNAEIEKQTQSINKLLNDPIDDSKIVRDELIQVSSDKDYSYELVGRESVFDSYGKMKREIKRAIRKDIIDEYIDSLGCSEDDKKVLTELIIEDFMRPKNNNRQFIKK